MSKPPDRDGVTTDYAGNVCRYSVQYTHVILQVCCPPSWIPCAKVSRASCLGLETTLGAEDRRLEDDRPGYGSAWSLTPTANATFYPAGSALPPLSRLTLHVYTRPSRPKSLPSEAKVEPTYQCAWHCSLLIELYLLPSSNLAALVSLSGIPHSRTSISSIEG